MTGTAVKEKVEKRISFHLHPYRYEQRTHAVLKSDNLGRKRRYIMGVTSGMKLDGHGERMTKACIDYMHQQGKSGSILLYEGQHGVTFTDDLGILVESYVTPMGEWVTEYRLYDEFDPFPANGRTVERADKLWRQITGSPPYVDKEGNPAPLQKGFSIEGYIPIGSILQMDENGGQRVIDRVEIDGVLVTPRPAYEDSAITAIYKALGELPPGRAEIVAEKIRNSLNEKISLGRKTRNYYAQRSELDDYFNDSIEEIIRNGREIAERLDILFEEYKGVLKNLLLENVDILGPSDGTQKPVNTTGDSHREQFTGVLKTVHSTLTRYARHLLATLPKE